MNQSLSEVMQNQSSSLITFDTQLKTALFIITTTGLNKEIHLSLVMWGRDAGIKSGCSEQLFLVAMFFFSHASDSVTVRDPLGLAR